MNGGEVNVPALVARVNILEETLLDLLNTLYDDGVIEYGSHVAHGNNIKQSRIDFANGKEES